MQELNSERLKNTDNLKIHEVVARATPTKNTEIKVSVLGIRNDLVRIFLSESSVLIRYNEYLRPAWRRMRSLNDQFLTKNIFTLNQTQVPNTLMKRSLG